MKTAILIFSLLGSSLCAEMIEKTYFVKGMHCGGCESGVKQSLLHLAGVKKEQIVEVTYSKPDPDNEIGSVVLKFNKDDYKGKATDCKLAKAIKKNPGYDLYWEKGNQNPCKL
ncbi:MAG: heavy-metal-associated domain-containing protein [Bdellovibrionales bacterium]